MGLRQVFATGTLALVEVRHRVQAQPVHAQVQPEIEHLMTSSCTSGLSKLRSGWWEIEAVPVVGSCQRVPSPIGSFDILEDDARLLVFLRGIAPDVIIAPAIAAAACRARWNQGAGRRCG